MSITENDTPRSGGGRRYLDFDLAVELRPESTGWQARVQGSPQGEAGPVEVDLDSLVGDGRSLIIEQARRGVRPATTAAPAAPGQQGPLGRAEAEAFGRKLFETVFNAEIASLYRASQGHASARGCGLRVRLFLPPALQEIPWEFLVDPESGQSLAASADSPVVRYLEVPEPVPALAAPLPLRILVMASTPSDLGEVGAGAEVDALRKALADLEAAGRVRLEVLERPTLPALRAALAERAHHVFHFIGHGVFRDGEGYLAFEDDEGRSRLVAGEVLALVLQDHASLRLTFLNACEGARTALANPFGGVAQRLVREGFPAVVAMQYPISVSAAVALSGAFYGALVQGNPLDEALAEGRKVLLTEALGNEWATPVFYLRSVDGYLLDLSASPGAAERHGLARVAFGVHGDFAAGADVRDALDAVAQVISLDELDRFGSNDALGDLDFAVLALGAGGLDPGRLGLDIGWVSGGLAPERVLVLAVDPAAAGVSLPPDAIRVDPTAPGQLRGSLDELAGRIWELGARHDRRRETGVLYRVINALTGPRYPDVVVEDVMSQVNHRGREDFRHLAEVVDFLGDLHWDLLSPLLSAYDRVFLAVYLGHGFHHGSELVDVRAVVDRDAEGRLIEGEFVIGVSSTGELPRRPWLSGRGIPGFSGGEACSLTARSFRSGQAEYKADLTLDGSGEGNYQVDDELSIYMTPIVLRRGEDQATMACVGISSARSLGISPEARSRLEVLATVTGAVLSGFVGRAMDESSIAPAASGAFDAATLPVGVSTVSTAFCDAVIEARRQLAGLYVNRLLDAGWNRLENGQLEVTPQAGRPRG